MKRRRFILLILVVGSVGCLAAPLDERLFPQQQPVTLTINNSVDTSQTFEVSVIHLPANYTIQRDDGVGGSFPIGEGITNANPGENHTWKTFELPDSARLHGRFLLQPGESNRSLIKNLPRDFAVVVVVSRDENEIVSYVLANCDDQALVGLQLDRRPHGVTIHHSCQ